MSPTAASQVVIEFPFSSVALLVGRQEAHPARKKARCWFVGGDDLTGALHVLQLRLSPLANSIILSSNKIQNGDVLVPANPDPSGKWLLKRRVTVVVVVVNSLNV